MALRTRTTESVLATSHAASALHHAAQRWPWLPVLYRLALIALAALLLAGLPWREVAAVFQEPFVLGDGHLFALLVLALAACVTGVLTLNYPGRAGVSILLLPVAVAWWSLALPDAVLVAAAGAACGTSPRRAGSLGILTPTARTVVATIAGASFAALQAEDLDPRLAQLLTAAGFVLAASAVDALLDWIDSHLHQHAGVSAHTDLLTNVLLAPLAVFMRAVEMRLGFDRLSMLLAGILALLLIVRASVNLRTLHTEVEEEREKLSTLFTHSGEGIFTVDGDLRVAALNPAMATLLDRPASAIEGLLCAEACHFEDVHGQQICPDRCPLRRAQAEQRPVSEEVRYQLPDRPPKHLLLTYAAVGDADEPLRLGIGIARDISAQKEAEHLRDDFVSLVTHELRSPLTVTTGYAGLLRHGLEKASAGDASALDPAKALRYLAGIEGASEHLLRLVNNLLDMARVERPELPVEYEALPLAGLIAQAVEAIQPVAAEKQQDVRLLLPADLPVVWTSSLYLREILGNLLSNAVKYTPADGHITVEARMLPAAGAGGTAPAGAGAGEHGGAIVLRIQRTAEGKHLHVAVQDTGIGISPEDQARLFTKFFRSDDRAARDMAPGTGLGLSIVKNLVELQGGRIWVESEFRHGSTFHFTLPLAQAAEAAAKAAGETPA